MLLARIVGTVVATRKDERLVSTKLLIARPIDPSGKPEGNYLVAVDTVDAGYGETVLIVSGSSARMAAGLKDCPVDAAIVGHRGRHRDQGLTLQLARVIGDVVATVKQPALDWAQTARAPADHAGSSGRRPDARRGRRHGRRRGRARLLRARPRGVVSRSFPAEVPVDACIVGIVDRWDVEV